MDVKLMMMMMMMMMMMIDVGSSFQAPGPATEKSSSLHRCLNWKIREGAEMLVSAEST